MKQVRKRLTYANVVSSLALFFVLAGGTAFAASQLGKNSVGPRQLKKNAVTAPKVKKNAITAAKIKPGAVTGAKIDEASLGTVPSAASANSANVAANLQGYQHNKLRLTPSPAADYSAGVNGGPETVLFSAGPLSVVAKCFNTGGAVYGLLQIRTSVDGSIFYGDYSYTSGTELLNSSTPGSSRILRYQSASGNYGSFFNEFTEFGAAAPDGTTVQGNLQIGVKTGSVGGAFGPGDGCQFGGTMFTL